MLGQHLVHEVERAVSRSLGAQYGATPLAPLAGEHALELVRQLLVLSVEVAYLACPHADVACWHVLVGAYVAV